MIKVVKSLTRLKFSEKIHRIKLFKTIHKAQAFQIENLLRAKYMKLKFSLEKFTLFVAFNKESNLNLKYQTNSSLIVI